MNERREDALKRIFDNLQDKVQPTGDHELLARFARQHDQAAFAALVKRHGPMVQRICQGMRLDPSAADDIFQATFLVLAEKVRSLRQQESVGSFLHAVAYRFALRGLRADQRRRRHEKAAAKPEHRLGKSDAESDLGLRETQGIIDGELAALADKYRVPLILHFLEGKTHDEAARQLHMPRRTVSRRIQRGTELLRKRLAKHGVEISAVFLALLIGSKAQAAITPGLAAATAKSAALFLKGSAPASSATLLTCSGITGLSRLTGAARLTATLKLWLGKSALVLLLVGALAGVWFETHPMTSRLANSSASSPTALPAPPQVVRGRILDEDGRPVPRAHVALLADRGIGGELGRHDEVLRQGQADADGAYVLEVPRDLPFWVRDRRQVKLLASAPGRALTAALATLGRGLQATDIRLGTSAMVRGQVVDNENRPAAGVAVHLVGFGPVGRESIQGTDELRSDTLPGWPQAVVTDHEGRFALAGLDSRQWVSLEVRDNRFGRQFKLLSATNQWPARLKPALPSDPAARNADGSADLTIQLAPPQWLEGQVLAADTGKPLAYARLSIVPCEPLEEHFLLRYHVDARADASGRFRMQPLPGGAFQVHACGPDNDPHLTLVETVSWPPGTLHKELTLALTRGIPVQGQVVEADTELPVGGAAVTYTQPPSSGKMTMTDKEGRFLFPVLPGRAGDLKLHFDADEYQLRLLVEGVPGAFVPVLEQVRVEAQTDCPGKDVHLVLQHWGQLDGQVMDGAGKPVSSGLLLTAGQFAQNRYRGARRFEVRDGNFLVAQAEVDGTYPIVLIDAARRQGVSTTLMGKVQNRLPSFALQPCGLAVGDLTSQYGHGLDTAPLELAVILPFAPSAGRQAEALETDWYHALNYDRPMVTTSRGKFVLPALVPGVRYRLYAGAGSARRLAKEFTVEPGQKLQLGSLAVRN